MHALSFGFILAFLFTSTHVLVDHVAGGHTSFTLLPHLSLSHTHSDEAHRSAHHDHEGEPAAEHDPFHHQADTHSHFVWYTHAGGKIGHHLTPSVLAFTMVAICPSVAALSTLSRYSYAHALPTRGLSLSLRWSILRI